MSPTTNAHLLALLATASLAGLLAGCGSGADERPNLVLITLDTTRPDYLGTYGYPVPTPGFDDLATEGVRFDMAVSSSALTPSSHATILTGLFPHRHGVRVLSAEGGFRLPEQQETLTTLLRGEGYSTACVNSAFPVSSHFGFDHGFEVWESVEGALSRRGKGWDFEKLQRRSDETTDRAIEVLQGLEEPFFLWIHYWDPHDASAIPPLEMMPDPTTLKSTDDVYAAEVRYVATQFARLCDELRTRGAWDRTLTVLTADHGEGLTDGLERHDWGTHRMLYQEQIRVPLLLRGPGVPRGQVVSDLVRTADVLPTVCEALGLETPTGLDGRSLLPLIQGRPGDPRLAYAEQINGYDRNAGMVKKRPDASFMYCVIEDGWKLVYRPHMLDRSELFHLTEDPNELVNLFTTETERRGQLLTTLANMQPWVLEPFAADPNAAERDVSEAFEALGYAAGGGEGGTEWQWTCPLHLDHRQDESGVHEDCAVASIPVRD